MASNLSRTEICNLALDYLDEVELVSFDDDTDAIPRWYRRNFDKMVESLLRQYTWNFAVELAELPEDATPPLFGFRHSYQIPTDCLRVLPLTLGGYDLGRPIPYKVRGDKIHTDHHAPLKVRYIKRITNTGLFDTLFVDVLACSLAQKSAHLITGKASYAQQLGQTLAGLIDTAKVTDAIEDSPDPPYSDYWLEARRS